MQGFLEKSAYSRPFDQVNRSSVRGVNYRHQATRHRKASGGEKKSGVGDTEDTLVENVLADMTGEGKQFETYYY